MFIKSIQPPMKQSNVPPMKMHTNAEFSFFLSLRVLLCKPHLPRQREARCRLYFDNMQPFHATAIYSLKEVPHFAAPPFAFILSKSDNELLAAHIFILFACVEILNRAEIAYNS